MTLETGSHRTAAVTSPYDFGVLSRLSGARLTEYVRKLVFAVRVGSPTMHGGLLLAFGRPA